MNTRLPTVTVEEEEEGDARAPSARAVRGEREGVGGRGGDDDDAVFPDPSAALAAMINRTR